MIRLLLTMIPQQRNYTIREEGMMYGKIEKPYWVKYTKRQNVLFFMTFYVLRFIFCYDSVGPSAIPTLQP
jgi:hypothetical protein